MVDCKELLPEGAYEGHSNNEEFSIQLLDSMKSQNTTFLCPTGIDSLTLAGDYFSDNFSYFKIQILSCDLGDECATYEEIANTKINFVSL